MIAITNCKGLSETFCLHRKLGSWDFWRIANSVFNKGKSAIPPLFNGLEVLSFASDKAKLFAKNFSKNSNHDDSGISLPVFISSSMLSPMLFLLYIHDLDDDVICDIAVYVDDTTLYSKCDQASDLWQQLELASELESDLQDTGLGQEVVNAGKTQLVLFDWTNNTGAIDVKMDGSVLEEKSFFKMLGLTFFSKLDWGSYIISIAKIISLAKNWSLNSSVKFLSPKAALYLYKFTIRPCMEYFCHVWASAPSYKKTGLLVLHLLVLLNP